MQLKCEQCGAPFQATDLHLERGLAICRACGGVQHLPQRSLPDDGSDSAPHNTPRKPTSDVPLPAQFSLDDDGRNLTIRQRWFHPALFFLLFFAIAWDSFLVFWYSMALGNQGPPGGFRWLMIIFPIAHVAVGVGITYGTLAGFLNTTVIRVADGWLSVQHGPLPWLGNVALATDDVDQIYCKRKTHRHRDDDGSTSTSMNYEVHAILGERQVKLLGGLHDPQQALFVEQRLERCLQIEDRPVPGEMSAA